MLTRQEMGPERPEKDPLKKKKHNWKKKSIFYELPYWQHNLIRHNLDVMHVEKNVCDNVLGTIMGAAGKTKDNLRSRRDLEAMGIRKQYHVKEREDGTKYFEPADFEMKNDGKDKFLLALSQSRMPDGSASNIARRVRLKGRTIGGLKSHDNHTLLQQLIPLCIRSSLPKNVVEGLIDLGKFFKVLCSKLNCAADLEEARSRIIVTLCDLEKIFPPSFFDVMEHLPIHLAEEALIAGAVQFRWMYPIERYLLTLKQYVRQRAHPEASIANGYLMEECMNFCSQYLKDMGCKSNRPLRRKNDEDNSKKGKTFLLSDVTRTQIHRWVLFHTDAVTPYLKEHMSTIKNQYPNANDVDVARIHFDEFADWFKAHVSFLQNMGDVSLPEEILALSNPPSPSAARLKSYTSKGHFFRVKSVDKTVNDRVRDEPFILASQAHQVWYIPDPSGEGWLNVSEVESKDFSHVQFDTSDEMESVVAMLGKKRKVGRPRHMSEFLSPSGSTSTHNGSSSSQSSYTSIRPPLIPPAPLPSPPQPTPSTLPLPAPNAQPQPTSNIISRGHNKGIPEWNTREKVNIMFDSKFQPVGERATQLKSQLGKIVRDGRRIPLTIMDWKSVDDKVKEGIWNEVKTNLVDVPEGYKPVCLKSCNYLWNDHKSKTKSNYFVPNKSNPELSSMVPPNIIADQWTVLVAYWNTEDAKAIATRNSINRETRGPSHNTGRKNFAQLRYEMEQSGEESDKFSVWKKARKESNPEVAQVINEYNRKLLLVRPVEDQKLTAVKDRVFHDVIGEDGHGYCRTYGSTVPRNLVYPQEPLETASSNDLIAKITEEVTEKLKESFDKKLEDAIKMLQAQIANNMDCTIAQRGRNTIAHGLGEGA
ncbi:hypothetical protein ACLB2K_041062 [Fragaria x ananassa]